MNRMVKNVSIYFLIGIILLNDLLIGFWDWLLKDGMGPDAVESHGLLAISRFLHDFWPIPLISALLILGLCFLLSRRSVVTK